MFIPMKHCNSGPSRIVRPEFFFLFFVLQTLPTQFFGNLINFFFSILFLHFPPTHASTVLEFNYVFLVLSFLLLPG